MGILNLTPDSFSDGGLFNQSNKAFLHIQKMIDKGANIVDRDGNEQWSMDGDISSAYKQEHKDLIDSIRAGKPIVELRKTAESSMTAVLGRMAAYTGELVTWDFATNESKLDLFPKDFDFKGSRPEPEFAIPGKTKLV